MKFKYIKMMARGQFNFVSLPLFEVGLPSANFIFLVDSGADYCYLPASVGEALGIDVKRGEKRESKGITGTPFIAYFHTINCQIGGWDYKMKIGFSYDLGVPFGILGRENFFDYFKVCIDHKNEEVELKPYK